VVLGVAITTATGFWGIPEFMKKFREATSKIVCDPDCHPDRTKVRGDGTRCGMPLWSWPRVRSSAQWDPSSACCSPCARRARPAPDRCGAPSRDSNGSRRRLDPQTRGASTRRLGAADRVRERRQVSSGRAWARNRISSIITDAIVMALRHDRARSGWSCSVPLDLVEQCGHAGPRARQPSARSMPRTLGSGMELCASVSSPGCSIAPPGALPVLDTYVTPHTTVSCSSNEVGEFERGTAPRP
jgi:hypothetical protein